MPAQQRHLQRLPRFSRSTNPPSFILTDRDIRILEHLHRLRFLTREQILRLEFSSGAISSCKRRLTLLYHNGYVERRYVPAGGTPPFEFMPAAYCLDRRGARLLASRVLQNGEELDWRPQENDRDVFFLAHLVATNDVFVALTGAAESFALPLRWTTERDLRRDLAGERIDGTTDLVPIPDAHAIVEHDGIEYSFAIELDRGTVEEKRIRKKIKAYGAWTPSAGYRRRFPEASLRVLFVVAAGTGSARRLERLRRWCEDEGGRSLFWFLEHSRVDERILFGRVWHVAGQRELRALLAPPVNLALPSLRTVSP